LADTLTKKAPWLSVITVVRDANESLARTVESLHVQTDVEFEYVIIDSSEQPTDVPDICSAVPNTYVWTEPAGIYAAMNHGLSMATGQYVYFLNAGDSIHDPFTLATVGKTLSKHKPGWAFGAIEVFSQSGRSAITPMWNYTDHEHRLFAKGHFPSHQGTFVSRQLLNSVGGFDMSYRIAADYAAVLQISKLSKPLVFDFVVADFFEGGVSTTKWLESLKEFHQARRRVFDPSGIQSAFEYADTAQQIISATLYRAVWSRLLQR
jgi:GT2 family glycosyltransferase